MHAAVTKIPHLLYEEDLLKTRKWYDFYLQNMVYVQWYDGNGRKKNEKYIYKKENKEKFPIWFPSHHPVYKIWRPTVFRIEKTGNKPDLP